MTDNSSGTRIFKTQRGIIQYGQGHQVVGAEDRIGAFGPVQQAVCRGKSRVINEVTAIAEEERGPALRKPFRKPMLTVTVGGAAFFPSQVRDAPVIRIEQRVGDDPPAFCIVGAHGMNMTVGGIAIEKDYRGACFAHSSASTEVSVADVTMMPSTWYWSASGSAVSI